MGYDATRWPHREEPLLDGNAHDGSGKPEKLNHQEEADSETFVMGSDAAEFENKVQDQVRSRQKRMSNVAGSSEEHSLMLGMFMAAMMNAATFMGKNFSTIQNFIMRSHFEADVRCHRAIGERPRGNPLSGKKCSGKEFMENTVTDWRCSYQSSAHQSLCLLGFCVVPREDPSTSRFQRSLEEQIWKGQSREKIMMVSKESRPNSSGTFSQGSHRCSSVTESMIC